MRLTVVGCSGSAPGPDSAASSYLIEEDGYRLVLDIGAGSSGPLQRYVAPTEIDQVIISHAHSDHWSDVTQLAHLRLRVGAPPLPVIGPSDLPEVMWTEPDAFMTTKAEPGKVDAGPIDVRLGRVRHGNVECWGTRIGDRLCYTADTAPGDEVEELASGCRVLLAEASGFDKDGTSDGHLSAGDAARLANTSGAKLLVLTHLRTWQDQREILDEASAIAECPVVLAIPGLRVVI